jgi:hypothetical protein
VWEEAWHETQAGFSSHPPVSLLWHKPHSIQLKGKYQDKNCGFTRARTFGCSFFLKAIS